MSALAINDADQLVSHPSWATASDYRRKIDLDGASADVFILETATIVDTPVATVRAERQVFVHADGSVTPPLESLRLITHEEDGYIEISRVAAVILALTEAAQHLGVAS